MKWFILLSVLFFNSAAAIDSDERLAELQHAVSDGNYSHAKALFDKDTAELIQQNNFFELSYYIPYAGSLANRSGENGTKTAEQFRDYILSKTDDLKAHRQAYLETHSFFREIGKYQLAYDMNAKALEITKKIPGHKPRERASIELNLGVIASELNDLELAKSHIFRAAKGFTADPETDEISLLNAFNSLGAIYWYEAQYDSVEYYWNKSRSMADSMKTSADRLYYLAMVDGNLSALFDVTGRTEKSILSARHAIANIKKFTETSRDNPKWNRAHSSLLYYSNNLAATYQGMGNHRQALGIFEFILKEKMARFPAGHPEIFFSEMQVGRANYHLKKLTEAKKWLNKSVQGFEKSGENNFKSLADAYSTLALIAEEEGDIQQAEKYYRIAETNYSKFSGGKFDFVYLNFITNLSEFYSVNNNPQKAVELSQKGLDYISESFSKNSLVGFRQNLNVGNVFYNLGQYEKSLQVAEDGLAILQNIQTAGASDLDSLRTHFDKPLAVLLQQKSVYRLTEEKTEAFLTGMLEKLKEALSIVDQRKTVLTTPEDHQVLMARFDELTGFIKKIQLELYDETGEMHYIDELLKLQEERVYTKIRNQLNLVENIDFHNLPPEITQKEKSIKASLKAYSDENKPISEYLEVINEWQEFLEMLRKNYPEYYSLRYTGSTVDSTIQHTSVQTVRYIFVDAGLLAVVFSKNGKKVHRLNFDPGLIHRIPETWNDPVEFGQLTAELYRQLWQPFGRELSGPEIRIIPDGILFNLSFEMLTPEPVDNFGDFAEKSLLAKHSFSYHYSLWLAQNYSTKDIKPSYVGFVPGFSDKMKEKYVNLVADSVSVDKNYLQLLPHPFTVKLADKLSKTFHGKDFVYDESTASAFKTQASGNKIIHIGTHAVSDNLSPAHSRLIFAKTDANPGDDNSVYAWEIYETEMASNLTLLTACETGNPVYQPGEGMISLAHAFQYAGSESLLTSLWNQDEKAGMEISGYFLGFLSRGMAKDRALREAKLKYLSNNEGRTLSPRYWAGLILVGNPEPLEGLRPARTFMWIAGGLLLAALIMFFFYRQKKKKI